MAGSPYDITILVTNGALLVINMLMLLQRSRRAEWCIMFALILRKIRRACSTDLVKDLLETRVQQEICARRIARAKSVMTISSGVVPCFLVPVIVTYALGGERSMTQRQDIILLGMFFLITLLARCPFLITSKTLDAWYFVLMGILCLFCSPLGLEALEIRAWAGNILIIQLWFALFNLRMRSIVIASIFTYLTLSCTYIYDEAEGLRKFLIDAGFSCMIFVGLMTAFQQCIESVVRHEVEKEGDQNMLSAIGAVLNTICEVVVELDSSLCLKDHAPPLADLLLLSPLQSLRAVPLTNYIPCDEDRQEFERHMHDGLAGSSVADAFHTRMRDTTGSTVCMEIFSVKLLGLDQRPRYILGMREFTDVPPVMKQVVQHPPRRWGTSQVQSPPQHGTPPRLERSELRPSSEESSSLPSRGSGISRTDIAMNPAADKTTTDRAMYFTLMTTMATWRSHGRLCCPMHAAAESAIRIAQMFDQDRCMPDFLEGMDWQCRTCGIMDEEFRLKDHEHCKLCKKWRRTEKAAAREESNKEVKMSV